MEQSKQGRLCHTRHPKTWHPAEWIPTDKTHHGRRTAAAILVSYILRTHVIRMLTPRFRWSSGYGEESMFSSSGNHRPMFHGPWNLPVYEDISVELGYDVRIRHKALSRGPLVWSAWRRRRLSQQQFWWMSLVDGRRIWKSTDRTGEKHRCPCTKKLFNKTWYTSSFEVGNHFPLYESKRILAPLNELACAFFTGMVVYRLWNYHSTLFSWTKYMIVLVSSWQLVMPDVFDLESPFCMSTMYRSFGSLF